MPLLDLSALLLIISPLHDQSSIGRLTISEPNVKVVAVSTGTSTEINRASSSLSPRFIGIDRAFDGWVKLSDAELSEAHGAGPSIDEGDTRLFYGGDAIVRAQLDRNEALIASYPQIIGDAWNSWMTDGLRTGVW